jgi:hypothetical protein
MMHTGHSEKPASQFSKDKSSSRAILLEGKCDGDLQGQMPNKRTVSELLFV